MPAPPNNSLQPTHSAPYSVLSLATWLQCFNARQPAIGYHHLVLGTVASAKPSFGTVCAAELGRSAASRIGFISVLMRLSPICHLSCPKRLA